MTQKRYQITFDPGSEQGLGAVVVLLHGLLLDHSIFSDQLERLAKLGFRVISLSYAGHGGSDRLGVGPSVGAMADQVFAMIDELGISEPVVIGGLSMGGYVAFAGLEKYRQRIRGLVLMNTRAVPDTTEEAANRQRACELIRQAKSISPLAMTMLPRLLGKSTMRHKPEVWQKVARILDCMDVEAACDALIALANRPDRRPMLSVIDVPTLVIAGEEDLISTPEEMELIAKEIAGSEFVIIPGVGHLSTLEEPEQVGQVLARFLQKYFNNDGYPDKKRSSVDA